MAAIGFFGDGSPRKIGSWMNYTCRETSTTQFVERQPTHFTLFLTRIGAFGYNAVVRLI